MNKFQHTPDGKIIINDLMVPLDWFITQEPDYKLPSDAVGQIYVPSKRHHITKLKGDTPCQYNGEHDEHHLWAEGDYYLSKYDVYATAYAESIKPPTPTPEEEDHRIAQNELWDIDLKSIRALREYVLSQPDCPQILKDRAAEVAVRSPKIIKDARSSLG